MKVLRSKYLVFTLSAGQSEWGFVVPPGLIETEKQNEFIMIVVRKMVFRNNIQAISAGRDKLFVDGRSITLPHGSPDVLSFIRVLNSVSQPLTWAFDPYDSRLTVKNSSTRTIELDPGSCGPIIGLDQPVQISPCELFRMPYILDLSAPQTLFLRLNALPSTSIEMSADGSARSRDLLCVVAIDSAPYTTFIYRDLETAYIQKMSGSMINGLTFFLTDNNDIAISFQTPATLIIEVQFCVDDEAQMLKLLQKSTDLATLKLLQKNFSVK